jgi:ribosomal-protein-alanine N-acetyltransferase
MNIAFRRMKYKDIDDVYELEKEAFTIPWPKHAFEEEMQNHLAYYTVGTAGKKVIAYGGMWLIVDEAHITNIAVNQRYRNLGIGKSLVDHMIQTAKSKGIRYMYLEVRKSNEIAYALYKKRGFIENGIRRNYYPDNQEDAILMLKVIL